MGLAVGTIAGFVNHWLLRRALARSQGVNGRKGQNLVMGAILLRMLVDFLVLLLLFLLYPRDSVLLLTAAFVMIIFIFLTARLKGPAGRKGF